MIIKQINDINPKFQYKWKYIKFIYLSSQVI